MGLTFGFNLNLRRYNKGVALGAYCGDVSTSPVGWCRFTLSHLR